MEEGMWWYTGWRGFLATTGSNFQAQLTLIVFSPNPVSKG